VYAKSRDNDVFAIDALTGREVNSARTLDAVLALDGLNALARRDPRAVLGVLEYWLAPHAGEGESSDDN
jgi:hypothetical protein